MNYIITNYPDYNSRRYGTPWAAPCDSTGRPIFGGKAGHFSGGRGIGGDLYVENPSEGSVWAYGQKDYRGEATEMKYVQFRGGAFHLLTSAELMAALNQAPSREAVEETQKLIKTLRTFLKGAGDDSGAEVILNVKEVKLLLGALSWEGF